MVPMVVLAVCERERTGQREREGEYKGYEFHGSNLPMSYRKATDFDR
jgi:hypothetical protein